MEKIRKQIKLPVLVLLLIVMGLTAVFSRFSFGGISPANAVTVSGGQSLSLVEMNNNFNKMLLRATMNKTLVFVERLYFDYSPLSSNRLAVTEDEDTDYVVINITNEAGEWAKVWGYVRHERGIRPDDPLLREMDLTYIEINQYWEWRTFTNEERWKVSVNDGYTTLDFTFDLNGRSDGAIYYIDGVYALPEHYYPQVAYWWDFTGSNPELLRVRDELREQALTAAATTPEGEPLRLREIPVNNAGVNTLLIPEPDGASSNVAAFSDDLQPEPMLIGTLLIGAAIGAGVVILGTYVYKKIVQPSPAPVPPDSHITNPTDPAERNDYTPPAPTEEQQEEYNKIVEENPLTESEREELEKRKEFSLDNDAPTGQKIVKLKVKDSDGVLQAVYDENGSEVYVNRETYTVGNATYAIINRETLLLIRWHPATMELKDIVGNKITVNIDNKLMNMDGVQPYSPKSRDDILKKMGDMGMYTSSIDASRMLYRMDDNDALNRAMNIKENAVTKGLWATITSAFKNLFGGGNTSKGFMSNFLDVLILIGVVLSVAFVIIFIFWFLRRVGLIGPRK